MVHQQETNVKEWWSLCLCVSSGAAASILGLRTENQHVIYYSMHRFPTCLLARKSSLRRLERTNPHPHVCVIRPHKGAWCTDDVIRHPHAEVLESDGNYLSHLIAIASNHNVRNFTLWLILFSILALSKQIFGTKENALEDSEMGQTPCTIKILSFYIIWQWQQQYGYQWREFPLHI